MNAPRAQGVVSGADWVGGVDFVGAAPIDVPGYTPVAWSKGYDRIGKWIKQPDGSAAFYIPTPFSSPEARRRLAEWRAAHHKEQEGGGLLGGEQGNENGSTTVRKAVPWVIALGFLGMLAKMTLKAL